MFQEAFLNYQGQSSALCNFNKYFFPDSTELKYNRYNSHDLYIYHCYDLLLIKKVNQFSSSSPNIRYKFAKPCFLSLLYKCGPITLLFSSKNGTRRILDNYIFCPRLIFLLLKRDKQNMKTDVLGNSSSSLISYILKMATDFPAIA